MMKYLKNVTTLSVDSSVCTGCGMCIQVCPHGVLGLCCGKVNILDPDACIECGACAHNCPVEAISVRAGVGCATGLIKGALGSQGSCCCTSGTDENSRACCNGT